MNERTHCDFCNSRFIKRQIIVVWPHGEHLCQRCDQNPSWQCEDYGEDSSCQQCGCLLDPHCKFGGGDDIVRAPYVTASGDLYCDRCGSAHNSAEESYEDDWDNDDFDDGEICPGAPDG